jgi:mRNA interferase YafQ
MRTIKSTSKFKRDYRREQSSVLGKKPDSLIAQAVDLLANDRPMRSRYSDHQLKDEWTDFRDRHLRPDLLLIYRKPDAAIFELVRRGSHSALGF